MNGRLTMGDTPEPMSAWGKRVTCWWHQMPFFPFYHRLRHAAAVTGRHLPGHIRFHGFVVRYTDLLSLYMEYKDIFRQKIYFFQARHEHPFIIDGGSCIGMSVLYFKELYPQAEIIGFEPDPAIFPIVRQNVADNKLSNVVLHNSGLSERNGVIRFISDGMDGGKISDDVGDGIPVTTVCLSDYIDRPVDFMKLNIEGQEWPVLCELEKSGKLARIEKLVLEYHGWAGGEQRLGDILNLLARNRFRFVVHDFDRETCATSKPPFRVTARSNWFCLVYAYQEGGSRDGHAEKK